MAKKKKPSCGIPFRITRAGHLLKTRGFSSAGRTLSTEGKREKAKRRKRGCLNGPPGTFKLTEQQKRKLHPNLQRAIIEHHRRNGARIID